jgi:hypothetical protein
VKWAGIGRAFVQFEKLPQSSTQFGVGGLQRSPSVIELRSKCPFATGTVDLRASFRNVFSKLEHWSPRVKLSLSLGSFHHPSVP